MPRRPSESPTADPELGGCTQCRHLTYLMPSGNGFCPCEDCHFGGFMVVHVTVIREPAALRAAKLTRRAAVA